MKEVVGYEGFNKKVLVFKSKEYVCANRHLSVQASTGDVCHDYTMVCTRPRTSAARVESGVTPHQERNHFTTY